MRTKSSAVSPHLAGLPKDLQREVLSYATGSDAAKVAATCKSLRRDVGQDDWAWGQRYDQCFAQCRDYLSPAARGAAYVEVNGARTRPQHLEEGLYAEQAAEFRATAQWFLASARESSGSDARRKVDEALEHCQDFPTLAAECRAFRETLGDG